MLRQRRMWRRNPGVMKPPKLPPALVGVLAAVQRDIASVVLWANCYGSSLSWQSGLPGSGD
jgi:hypothetical protein